MLALKRQLGFAEIEAALAGADLIARAARSPRCASRRDRATCWCSVPPRISDIAGLNADALPPARGAARRLGWRGAGAASAAAVSTVSSCWMRASSASTRALYSLFNACNSARSAATSSAARCHGRQRDQREQRGHGPEKSSWNVSCRKLTNTRARERRRAAQRVFQEIAGGARERKPVNARGAERGRTGAVCRHCVGDDDRRATTLAPPPTMFCSGADDRHVAAKLGARACESAFRCVLTCTTMPSWAQNSASAQQVDESSDDYVESERPPGASIRPTCRRQSTSRRELRRRSFSGFPTRSAGRLSASRG